MKTKILKSCCSVLIMTTLFACGEKSSKKYAENLNWDFCKTDCAVDCSEDYNYNTKNGSAYFTIPIPDGATLSAYKVVNDGKAVEFVCKNSKYSGKTVNVPVKIPEGELAKIKGAELTVKVAFEDYECEITTKATRNKGSVLQGNPVDDSCHCK